MNSRNQHIQPRKVLEENPRMVDRSEMPCAAIVPPASPTDRGSQTWLVPLGLDLASSHTKTCAPHFPGPRRYSCLLTSSGAPGGFQPGPDVPVWEVGGGAGAASHPHTPSSFPNPIRPM